jgi:hypothetical protein
VHHGYAPVGSMALIVRQELVPVKRIRALWMYLYAIDEYRMSRPTGHQSPVDTLSVAASISLGQDLLRSN